MHVQNANIVYRVFSALLFSGVWPSFSQLDWINKVYPDLQPKDKPLECIQEEGEILYLVSLVETLESSYSNYRKDEKCVCMGPL